MIRSCVNVITVMIAIAYPFIDRRSCVPALALSTCSTTKSRKRNGTHRHLIYNSTTQSRKRNGIHRHLIYNRNIVPPNDEEVVYHGINLWMTKSNNDINRNDHSGMNVRSSLTLLLFSQFLLFIGVGAVIPSIPLYGQELGLTGSANGVVISAPAVALLLCANYCGRLADRNGRKPSMIIGMLIIAISDIGTAASTSLPALELARLGLGVGRGISEAGERGMLADLANQLDDGMRGKVLAAQQASVAVGIAIGAPLGGIVVEQYGPRAAFLCVSVAAIITCAIYSLLPESMPQLSTLQVENDYQEEDFGVWRELIEDDEWKGLALAQAGASFGYAAKISSIPVLAAGLFTNGAAGSGALLSAAALSGLIGAPLGGIIADGLGSKQTAVIGGIVSGISLALIPLAVLSTSPWLIPTSIQVGSFIVDSNTFWFSISVLIWSMATALQGPAMTALAQQKAAVGTEATSLAFVKAAGDATYIAAPFLMGILADTVHNVAGVECLLAGSTVVIGSLALAFFTKEEKGTARVD